MRGALFGQLTKEDWQLVENNLSDWELKLFQRLDRADQHHSIQVAKIACSIVVDNPHIAINQNLLIKASLLHDLGKIDLNLSLFERILPVVLTKIWPWLSIKLGQLTSNTSLLRCFYVYWNHGEVGAKIAQQHHLPHAIIHVIAQHQGPAYQDDDYLLQVIKEADSNS